MAQPVNRTVTLDEGWGYMVAGVAKLQRILVGDDGKSITPEDYMNLYTTIFNMCTQKPPYDYSKQLYDRFKEVLDGYVKSTVSPSLKEKHGEFLLREFVQRWRNHKVMVRWLARFFNYLDRYYVARMSLQPLKELGLSRFHDLVFNGLKKTVTTILIDMVSDEREGQLIDRALIKEVLDIYVEIAHGNYGLYQLDFEQAFLKGTTDYYSKKAQTWILEDSCPDYMLKVDDCLQKEKERVAHYLHSSTEPKLMNEAILELLGRRAEQILNMENSGCRVLLRDGKTGDLSRMFSLFSRMETGLLQLSKVFKEHASEEGMSLLKQATDAARSRKNEKKEVAGSLEQDFVWKVIKLHDKYLAYVANCFENNNIFHKSLKESFEVICNKDVADRTSAEMVATFCDNILRKGGSEKLRDEAVEEILDKVVNIVTYTRDKGLLTDMTGARDHQT